MARICHLTLLNPATHTRIFAKIARSQLALGHEVMVAGQDESPHPYLCQGVTIFPLKPFRRLSPQRILAQIRILRTAVRARAHLYTIHTPELIFVALFLRWFRGAKIIYDVHEDYAANIRYGKHYPAFLKYLLAGGVRFIEKRFVSQTDAISFAEACYAGIFDEPKGKRFFLRNKFQMSVPLADSESLVPPFPYLLYTGTIAEDWGIFETIALWKKMNQVQPINLVVAGHSQDFRVLQKLERMVAESGLENQFTLIGGEKYAAHSVILSLIKNCTFGTALYRMGVHISGKIPTKFYEYMAFGKPLVFTSDPYWNGLNQQMEFGVPYDDVTDISALLEAIAEKIANPEPHRKEDFHWSGEEGELRKMLLFVLENQNSSST
ncbi:MAG: glycosyltransferase [Bacteroidia bacterium]